MKPLVTVEMKGLKKFLQQLQTDMPKSAEKAAQEWVANATYAIHSEAIAGIRKTSQGKRAVRYFPGGGKRIVTVSKPGDPFNIDTGETHATIQPRIRGLEGKIVGSLVAYWLEIGTSRVAARPWLRPAVRAVRARLGKMFKFKLGE